MKRVTHRALSLLLSLTLLFSLIPGTALAAGNGEISSVNLGSTGLSMELNALPAIDTTTKVEVQVYSGDTLLTAVKLTSDSDKRAALTNLTHLTCCIPTGTADSYWPQTPDWKPRADLVPTKAVLIVNDAEADTFPITNIDAADWAGLSDVAPAPSGSIERVGITEEYTTLRLRNAVSVDLKNVTFYQSVQVKLYSGGTLLTTATLTGVAAGSHPFMTCCIATETPDAYWALTDWTPKDDVVPDKAELWVDGVKQGEKPFTLDKDEWAELPGVKQMLNVQFRNWNATTGDYSHQWSGDVENGAVINVARPTVVPTIEHLVKQKVENTSGGNRYEFKGWTTHPDDPEGRKFDPYADQVTSDLVLYPVFKQVFNVQFKNWNAATGEYGHQWSGDVEKDAVIDVARATLVPLIENIVKNNVDLTLYKFEGWTTDPDDPEGRKFDPYADQVTSDLVLYPVFTPTTFTVTFNSNGGTGIEAQTVQYGGKATKPTTTKTGYTFQGWFLDEGDARREYDFDTLVTGPITLTAQWTPITYTIVYHGNGGVLTSNGDKDQSTSTCTYDQEFTLKNAATFTRTGFAFQGWSTTENGGVVYTAGQTGVKNLASVQGEKVDLYAVWEGNAYTVTFNADGGSLAEGDQSKTVTYDSTYGALPTPTKTGYTFAGWYLGDKEITAESKVETAENHTLTAQWTANSYTIRYNHNDGNQYHYIEDSWAKYNQEATIYSPYYSIQGYTFQGWAFTADATAPVYKVGQKVVVNETNFPGLEDLKSGGVYHLYAVWKANEYTVSFIDNGVEVGTQNFVYDIAQNLTAYTGTKPGCVFQGWDVDNDGDVDYTDGALVKNLTAENNGKVELVAVWKDVTPPEVDYTVSAGDTENNRYVVIKANEPIQQPANGWSKVENKYVEPGTQWKMPHLEYGKVYNFTIKDLAGNETPLTIDLKAPVVTAEYDPATLTNQNVTVTLTFDEAVTISDDWTQIDAEGKVYKKTFAENTTETVEFADTAKYPNAGTYKVVIDYIDKIAPKVSYVINGNQVIISADEVIQSPAKGWSKVENKYTTPGTKWKRTVTRGTSIDLNIKDLAGNVTPLTIDLEAPVATVSYDPTEITESSVVVTISFDELTKITSEDWAATGADADGFATKWTKTYTANTTETVDFVDAVKNDGNKSSVEVKVDNIRIPLNVTINGNTKTVTYNGKEQNVKAVLPNAATLPAEVTIAFKDGVVPSVAGSRAGTYTRELTEDMFTVNGGGKYNVYLKFEGKLELVIEPKDIKDAVVSDIAAVTYNGQEQKPTGFDVTVKLGYNWDEDTVLSSTTDYDVSYSNNINAGTATVTITGKGNFTGTKEANFTIAPKELNRANRTTTKEWSISVKNDSVYDGTEKEPAVTIKFGDTVLTEGVDYELEYNDNVNAGEWKAYVVVTFKGNFTGSDRQSFNIAPKELNRENRTTTKEWSISVKNDSVYDGTEKEPAVTIKFGDTVLTEGVDYELEYNDNVNAGEWKAYVVVTFKGNFTGNDRQSFNIAPAPISDATVGEIADVTYNTKAHEPAVTVTYTHGNKTVTLVKDADYTVAYADNINAGTATVTITGIGNYKGEVKKTFKITSATITDENVTIDPTEVEWTGSAQTVDVTVKYTHGEETVTLVKDTDYTVAYSNNTDVGKATVTITGKGNYTGEVTKTFEIIIATYTGSFDVNVTYDGTRPLRGAKFGLYTNAACTDLVMTATTDTDGRATFTLSTEIEPNSTKTLYLKQISAPAGYSKDSNTYTVVLTPDGKSFTAEIATMTTVRTFARAATVAVGETGGSIDIVNPPVISSGSSASSTIVTFVAGDEYALEAQKGTSAKTDGSVQVSLSGTKVAENKVPDVIPADAYYEFIDWAIENKDGELTTIDLETYKFTKNNIKIYAIMEDTWTPYIDMKKDRSDWYYQYVRDLSIASVVGGYPDGTFGSRNEVTWGQALKLIMLAVGYDVQEPVEGGHWASGYLMKALQDGLVSADQNIDLNAPLSRVEYARVAYAAMGLKLSKIDNPFIDTDDASVIALYEAGIVEGSFNANGRVFKPEDNISRAEMSAVIWRIMNYER